MSKKIGRHSVTGELLENLKGFEDVLDDYVKSEEYRELERKEREHPKVGEQYELQHFLEQENERLKGLEIFLSKKIPLKMNFSQTEKLILHQLNRKGEIIEKLTEMMLRNESQYQKNISQLMNAHFA